MVRVPFGRECEANPKFRLPSRLFPLQERRPRQKAAKEHTEANIDRRVENSKWLPTSEAKMSPYPTLFLPFLWSGLGTHQNVAIEPETPNSKPQTLQHTFRQEGMQKITVNDVEHRVRTSEVFELGGGGCGILFSTFCYNPRKSLNGCLLGLVALWLRTTLGGCRGMVKRHAAYLLHPIGIHGFM